MDIEKKLKECGKGSVCVKLFADNNGNYILCPYGRSPSRKWIGISKLDYFVEGSLKNDFSEDLLKNIYECINISMNFDKLNVDRCLSSNDKLTSFLKVAKKEKYNGYSIVSIDLDPDKDYVEIVEWEKASKSSNEWRGNPDTFISLKYDEFDSKVIESVLSFIKSTNR